MLFYSGLFYNTHDDSSKGFSKIYIKKWTFHSLYVKLISALGKIRSENSELSYGDYKELFLTNKQYAFSRNYNNHEIIIVVNNDINSCNIKVPAPKDLEFIGLLSGQNKKINSENGYIDVTLDGASRRNIYSIR